ncbi:hypothetical protein PENANT_c007G07275 [Penicillium antarcticum]|uniref:Uncharacterized protein n=1 Tax=Penicillium antarcticum TaxID=416450 RepID=A0A1V6QBC5_9EURO|nr:hypothetical protein PENANT_c007G07275 [Penicillium antarcticum]
MREHIVHIRDFIKKSKELGHDVVTDKFFDSVSFWQQAYEQSEAGQSKLHDQIYELEQRNNRLMAKIQAKNPVNQNDAPQTNKRTTPPGRNVKNSNRVQKRAKIPHHMQRIVSLMNDDSSGEEYGLCLSRQIYTLQKALQRNPMRASSLATAAIILCKSAEQMLICAVQRRSMSTQPIPPNAKQDTDINDVFNGVKIAFHLVHRGLHKLSRKEDEKQHRGQITYYLVGLFESTMTAFTQHCTAISKQKSTTETANDSVDGSAAQPQQNINKRNPHTEDEIATCLADLLCTVALSLDISRTEDQQVMEGFLSLVLDRVGKMLALYVFHDLRLPMSISPRMTFPGGLEAMADENLTPNDAQLEAKFLIRLLGRMMDSGSAKSISDAQATRSFVQNARTRVQNTLLRAVFGHDDKLFRDGLQRPKTPPSQAIDANETNQEGFADWFTQELWRVVGWDVLRSAFALN